MSDRHFIHIYYSDSVDILAHTLSHNIHEQIKSGHDPLIPVEVVVPNGNMQRYLDLTLAADSGIVANVAYPYLEQGFFQALKRLDRNKAEVNLASIESIAFRIMTLLKSLKPDEGSVFDAFLKYLQSDRSKPLAAKKIWQLAQQMALLFLDYEMSRPAMVSRWRQNKTYFDSPHTDQRLASLEQSQKALYRAVFKDSSSDALMTLSQYSQRIETQALDKPRALHLFTPSRLNQFHRQIILKLAEHYQLSIYHLNVCREFWLDMETEGEKNWREKIRSIPLQLTDQHNQVLDGDSKTTRQAAERYEHLPDSEHLGNPLLKAWGKPGREILRLFSELEADAIHLEIPFYEARINEQDLVAEPPANHSLRAMQQAILNRLPQHSAVSLTGQTVQISAAPSMESEVTQVYHNMLYQLKNNKTLLLTDMVVLVTDMVAYRFVIQQVFDRLNRHVTSPLYYSISDSSVAVESFYARAVEQFFKLLENDFIRDEVFDFLKNPCVMAANGFKQSDWHNWLLAAQRLGIYQGFNHLYESSPEQPDLATLYTWQQGIEKLHLSLASDDQETALDSRDLGRFTLLMESLNEQKTITTEKLQGHQWLARLQELLDTFLAVPDDYLGEQSVANAVSSRLQALADSESDLVLNYYELKSYLLDGLQQMSAGQGRYLTGGVVCAALQPMRPVPFKITYVLGLGAAEFPGSVRHNTLDLTRRSRRIGDVDTVEANKYLFLETLMSSREQLFLSYVGKDPKTNEVLQASVVVDEVRDWLQAHVDADFEITPLSLQGADVFIQKAMSPEKPQWQNFNFSDYLLYRKEAEAGIEIGASQTWLAALKKSFSQPQQKQAMQRFEAVFSGDEKPLSGELASSDAAEKDVDTLSVKQLIGYCINPSEAIFKKQGGTLNRIEDHELISEEPLKISALDKYFLYQKAVTADLALYENPAFLEAAFSNHPLDACENLGQCLDTIYQSLLDEGHVPISLFSDLKELKAMADDKQYAALKADIKTAVLEPLTGCIRMGQSYASLPVAKQLTALSLPEESGKALTIEGTIENLLVNKAGELAGQVLISSSKHSKTKEIEKLMGFHLQWCLMQLHADLKVAEFFTVWLVFGDKVISKTWDASKVSKITLADNLGALSAEFMADNSHYLPVSFTEKLKLPKQEGIEKQYAFGKSAQTYYFAYDLNDIKLDVDALHEKYDALIESAASPYESFNADNPSAYDEVKRLLTYPADTDFLLHIKQRFLPFFALYNNVDLTEAEV